LRARPLPSLSRAPFGRARGAKKTKKGNLCLKHGFPFLRNLKNILWRINGGGSGKACLAATLTRRKKQQFLRHKNDL
jgi:hypothetical protein